MNLPKNLGELTIRQFQKLTKIYKSDKDLLDKGIEAVALLSGKTIKEVGQDMDIETLLNVSLMLHPLYLLQRLKSLNPILFIRKSL